jgi:hypothetical protein
MYQKLKKTNKVLMYQKSLFLENLLFLLSLFSRFCEVLGQNVSWSFTYLTTQQLNTNKA